MQHKSLELLAIADPMGKIFIAPANPYQFCCVVLEFLACFGFLYIYTSLSSICIFLIYLSLETSSNTLANKGNLVIQLVL